MYIHTGTHTDTHTDGHTYTCALTQMHRYTCILYKWNYWRVENLAICSYTAIGENLNWRISVPYGLYCYILNFLLEHIRLYPSSFNS